MAPETPAEAQPGHGTGHRRRAGSLTAWLAAAGMCSLLLVLWTSDLVPSQRPKRSRPVGRARRLLSREQELLAMDWVSLRQPPPGFEHWVFFARQHQCHLGPYERIDRDLQAFAVPGEPKRRRISREQLEAAKQMSATITFAVSGGALSASQEGPWADNFRRLVGRFARFLPDMEFVVNVMDEPRVLPGPGLTVAQRFASTQCANASADFQQFRHLHGSINNPPLGLDAFSDWAPADRLLPLFSQTKIDACHADIQYPTLYNLDALLSPQQQQALAPWEARNATLFFRGSTTDGHFRPGGNYSLGHRHRLVELAASQPHMDVRFTDFIQCSTEQLCAEQEARYGKAERVDVMEAMKYKHVMSVDGNTFVGRLPRLLSGGGLVFRAGMYAEWFDEWLRDGEHYMRVKLDYSDLLQQLDWARSHDAEARLIGQRARQFALSHLRNQDLECYMFRLLLEYSAILER